MEKTKCSLRSLIIMCVFALMMGITLIPQTVNAAGESETIYWAVTSGNLTISDQEIAGDDAGSFPADTVFTDIDDIYNSAPWGSVKTATVEGSPAPQHTDYWFSGCDELETIDITNLDLSKCESMIGMFKGCQWLEIVNLYNADISACTNFSNMLQGCLRLQMLVVGPSWCNLPDESMRATFPTTMYRRDVDPNQSYNGGTLVPEYIPSNAGLNIYVINWSSAINDANPFVKVLWKIHALPGIEDPELLQDAAETALFEYNRLANRVKVMVPDEAIAILEDALRAVGINELPKQIKIKWSSIDGDNLAPPFTYDIPPGGIKVSDFLGANYTDICSHFAKDGYSPFYPSYYYASKTIGFHPINEFSDRSSFEGAYTNWPNLNDKLTDFTIFYFYSTKSAGDIKTTVNPLRCGMIIDSYQQIPLTIAQEDIAKVPEYRRYLSGFWAVDSDGSTPLGGTVKGGQDYYFCVTSLGNDTGFGYNFSDMRFLINGQPTNVSGNYYIGKVTAIHDPNSSGICKSCGKKVAESNMGTDGTPVGPGASAETAEQAITSMKSDTDPKGAVFGRLALKSNSQGKNSIKLNWNKVGNTKTYVLYGNKCGNGNKPVKISSSTSNAITVKTIKGTKLAKGTYYKFIIVALDKNNKVISTSKLIHVATSGGKVGNHKKVTVKKSITKKAKKLKKGKSLKLKAKAVKKSKKVKKHVGVRYESTNSNIAAVSAKGVVKANNKGTCYVYAYAQNGVSKKIKITVK